MVIEGDFRLTEGEQLKLLQTDQALQFVQTCFLYQSDEAFVSLCMLLCLGKDFCSPSKKNQRAARIDLFETVAINSGRAKNKAHKYRLSYRDLAKGFSKLSDRWHLFARDELLSLAILIDAQQGRLIDRDAFLTFVAMVFDEYKRDMPHQKTIFRSIFNNLREGLYSLYITEENKVVAQKLALLAVKARSMKMEPMRMLLHAIQSKESAAEVVVFVEALVESCSGRDHDGHGEIEDSFESAQGDYESHPKQSDDSTTYGERVVIEDMTEDSSALQIGDLYTSKQATNVASDIVEGNKSAQENIMQVVQVRILLIVLFEVFCSFIHQSVLYSS